MRSKEEYLDFLFNVLSDIIRLQNYRDINPEEKNRWEYDLLIRRRLLPFIRVNNEEDIEYRNKWKVCFHRLVINNIPSNLDLRFHGTPIYNAKAILESGGIFSSIDINNFLAGTDPSGQISAFTLESLHNISNSWVAGFEDYKKGLPCGCIFVLLPRTKRDIELKESSNMESVNFKEHPEQLYSIVTSPENITNVRSWLEKAKLNPELVCTFEDFIEKLKKEKEKQEQTGHAAFIDRIGVTPAESVTGTTTSAKVSDDPSQQIFC